MTSKNLQKPKKRDYLPASFKVDKWESVKPYFDELQQRKITSLHALNKWLLNVSELESVLSEDMGWRYIRMTCSTENPEYAERYQEFVQYIQPEIAKYTDQLNHKLMNSPWLPALEEDPMYFVMIRNIRKNIRLFRQENVPLLSTIDLKKQAYAKTVSGMTVDLSGKEVTLQQAATKLLSPDRSQRETVWKKITQSRLTHKDKISTLYTELVQLRHQVATQADVKNFRDYMFLHYGRFDYSPSDCFTFHDSIASEVLPLVEHLAMERKEKLQVDQLRPWDLAVDPQGREPLKVFNDENELMDKTISCVHQIDPYISACLDHMRQKGHFDLSSRKGKAPGGYNYPLLETGIPFIFMNATSTLRDLVTLLHESGHAIHSFLTQHLPLNDFKSPPMEVAELSSMSMELMTLDHWHVFFTDEEDQRRARHEQLANVLETLPWIATIDMFQHWVYENPQHTKQEFQSQWDHIFNRFTPSVVDWKGLEEERSYLWQKQLHLFEVPFYYIEYGMAQLGAIAVWRNYKRNKQKGWQRYREALSNGNCKTIAQTYEMAGIRFDFSQSYIRELMAFLRDEWDN